ncbi:MAG: 2-isopropylmalate synthase [Anaerolineales bacterium]|nr:2-isopropylmalate synthase [Anaerolineales bacterium]
MVTKTMTVSKYRLPAMVDLPDRQWPSRTLTESPIWVSVDLRDGNQALPNPLNPQQKLEYFELLCDIGFKQIEVGFPSASQDDFDFARRLIVEDRIPDDTFIMVLTQCRSHLIERTFESIKGVRQAILHAYIATSELHMNQVFGLDHQGVMEQALTSVRQIREAADAMPESDIRFEFSPEEFTDSDLDFVLELCEAVYAAWGKATPEKPMIFNLPATVERRPPNHYADMIEWFCRHFPHPEGIIVSLHSHNDQGMAVAATELALMAGAGRVEGTLFGHGERTGNVDLVTLVNNLYSRGLDTGLDFSNLPKVAETVVRLTGMPIYYRAPYAGEYVFTAFSGSHQDAIRKGMNLLPEAPEKFGMGFKVPYLHIDPTDLGREYESLIRINSQSGKGGMVYVLEKEFGIEPPKQMHPEIGRAVQEYTDELGREISASEVLKVFETTFVEPQGPYQLVNYWPRPNDEDPSIVHGELILKIGGREQWILADGNGPISAFMACIRKLGITEYSLDDYFEQAVGKGADAIAYAYVPLKYKDNGILFGVGTGTNINQAAVKAIMAGMNRWAMVHKPDGK